MAQCSAEADGNADNACSHNAGHVRVEERSAAAPTAFHKREVRCRHRTARRIQQKVQFGEKQDIYVGRRRRDRCQLVEVRKQCHVAMHHLLVAPIFERHLEVVYLSITENA